MGPGTADSSGGGGGGGGGGTDGHAEKLMEGEASSSTSSSTIEVHLRIRPSPNPSAYHEIDDLDRSTLIFTVPADHRAAATTAAASSAANSAATTSKGGYVDNTRTRYAFKFNSILEPSTCQATVFNNIGMPAIRNALEGYNSTVFAYGQTGSGKTYTITGGPERYEDRGIIPRAITMLFEEFGRRGETTGASYNCYISYLELYNESMYDLLAQKASASLHEVPKVTMLEDEDGNLHFRNLSIHAATSEEEALNLLFLGDTNRAIGETEMNQSSSRSHCIFTIMIECRPGVGGAAEVGTLIKSKLNLVDLSGSERVHKTSSTGQTLTEAKYINSSLFFLEMVIVALHEKASGRGGTTTTMHVPYRNSMMTSVLRDSLGGNCKTVMIATMSPEAAQVSESISTCQFAQRVALVRNTAKINEELEPAVIIRRLRAEVGRLREEVKYLRGENAEEEGGDDNDDGFGLDRDQRLDLERRVEEYVEDRNEGSVLDVGTVTLTRMQYAHGILKRMLLAERSGCSSGNPTGTGGGSAYTADDASLKLSELERTLQRRDHEIAILVDMVKKENGLPPTASFQQVAHLFRTSTSSDQRDESATTNEQEVVSIVGGNFSRSSALCTTDADASTVVEDGPQTTRAMQQRSKSTVFCGVERCVDREIVEDPSAAFHFFRQRYPGSVSLNETKAKLKAKYQEAKDVGQIVQQSKAIINEHSRSIESLRRSRAMDGLTSGERFDQERIMEPHPDEEEHRSAIQQEKVAYRNAISRLKELKSQIEYTQKLVEKHRLALQRDFDIWYSNVCDEGSSGAIGSEGQRSSQNCTTADVPAAAAGIVPTSNSSSQKSCAMTRTSSSAADEAMGAACSSLSSRSPATGTTCTRVMSKRCPSGQSRVTGDDGLKGTTSSSLSFGGGASDLVEQFQLPAGVRLTGNKDVDNDIVAFYKAKAELMVAKTGR